MPDSNPYQSPQEASEQTTPLVQIKKRLSRPATALIIMGSIQSVMVSVPLVSVAMILFSAGPNLFDKYYVVIWGLQFASSIVIAIGAAKMGFLESYAMARIAAVLACVPLVSPFLFLGIPFGIWSLALLRDPEIKAAFNAES